MISKEKYTAVINKQCRLYLPAQLFGTTIVIKCHKDTTALVHCQIRSVTAIRIDFPTQIIIRDFFFKLGMKMADHSLTE